jgi:hypothetical protein
MKEFPWTRYHKRKAKNSCLAGNKPSVLKLKKEKNDMLVVLGNLKKLKTQKEKDSSAVCEEPSLYNDWSGEALRRWFFKADY